MNCGENSPRNSRKWSHAIALDHSVLLELLNVTPSSERGELVRQTRTTRLCSFSESIWMSTRPQALSAWGSLKVACTSWRAYAKLPPLDGRLIDALHRR